MGVNNATKTHDPLRVGQPTLGLIFMSLNILSDPQGVDIVCYTFIPRSFGLRPPTRGLQQNGPPFGGPYPQVLR